MNTQTEFEVQENTSMTLGINIVAKCFASIDPVLDVHELQ